MLAFIEPPGAKEKAEDGQGLFERSEFRSSRLRVKQKTGIPDNEQTTFPDYFFMPEKK